MSMWLPAASAAWYWPFGADKDEPKPPRISELMAPATFLIDEASDLAEENKIPEAVDKYKMALLELDRIELQNPDRAQKAEFATLRNKRAYVNGAIDSLLLKQARENARAVAVTDTTELEKRLLRKRGKLQEEAAPVPASQPADESEDLLSALEVTKVAAQPKPAKPKASAELKSPLQKAVAAVEQGDYESAFQFIEQRLTEKPNDATALNLRAAVETEQGNYRAAEDSLDQAIRSNPRSYYAYYNMARLYLKVRGAEGQSLAHQYYKVGRQLGGPQDADLEAQFQ